MKTLILRILTLQPVHLDSQVFIGAVFLWVILVAVSVRSLVTQPISRWEMLLWGGAMLALPLLGVLVYALYSLRFVDFSFMRAFFTEKEARNKALQPRVPLSSLDAGSSPGVQGRLPAFSREVYPSISE